MTQKPCFIFVLFGFAFYLFFPFAPSWSAEKLKFGASVKVPNYELPLLAADEKGIWKENGLEVESLFFSGGGPFGQALAARAIKMGYTAGATTFLGLAGGLPTVIVSDLGQQSLSIWVAPKSAMKNPKDLAGARIGMSSLGSMPHAYGMAVAKALGLQGKIRFVAVGGIPARMAGLKAGAIDGHISPLESMAGFQQKGELRELVRIRDYIPPDSVDNVMVAHKEVIGKEPATVAKVVRAGLQTLRFLRDNPAWATQKLALITGHSEEVARLVYEEMMRIYTRDGKISPKALENLRDFLIEYKIIAPEKAPRLEETYTGQFLS